MDGAADTDGAEDILGLADGDADVEGADEGKLDGESLASCRDRRLLR